RFGCESPIQSRKRLDSACTRPSCPRLGSILTRLCSSWRRSRRRLTGAVRRHYPDFHHMANIWTSWVRDHYLGLYPWTWIQFESADLPGPFPFFGGVDPEVAASLQE